MKNQGNDSNNNPEKKYHFEVFFFKPEIVQSKSCYLNTINE